MLAMLLAFGLALGGCPTEDKGEDPPAQGILTVNNLPEGLAAAMVFQNFSSPDPIASVIAPGSTAKFELYNVSNSTSRFTQSGNFFVVVNSLSAMQDRYKESVVFTNGSAVIDWTTMTTWSSGGQTYTVTYNRGTGGGTAPVSQTVNAGESISLPGQGSMTPPGGSGTFTGWSSGGIIYSTGQSYMVNGNVTFTAQWSGGGGGQTYTVTYNRGTGGGTAPASQTVNAGESINLPGQGSMTPPGGSGTFTGWSSGGTNYSSGETYTVNGNVTFTAQWQTINAMQEGLYVGIIKFADNAVDLTSSGIVSLNAAGKNTLDNILNTQYNRATDQGTALFYGAHLALAKLKANESAYPANLHESHGVNIITFTDGLDTISAYMSRQDEYRIVEPHVTPPKNFANTPAYTEYVQSEITSRTIAGKSINAYSVGVVGVDVPESDRTTFTNNLTAIADRPDRKFEQSDFSQVEGIFQSIASSLNTSTTTLKFNARISQQDIGTKVRMTFDLNSATASAATSAKYIEATLGPADGQLSNITYGGISSSAGAGPLTGTKSGTSSYIYEFDDFTGYVPDGGAQDDLFIRQWFMNSGSATWTHNTEYHPTDASNTTTERKSSIIYLVLDNSESLSSEQVTQIRNAAKSFVQILYNNYNAVPNAPVGLTATRHSATSGTISWNPVSGATSYKVYQSSTSGGTYSLVTTVTTSSYSVSVSGASSAPYFKVTALNDNGESAQSSYTQLSAYSSGGTTTLSSGVWANGNLTQSGQIDQYSFNVTSGTTYRIWWNDSYQGNSTKTGDVMVSAQYSGGSTIFSSGDSAWDTPQSFTPSTNGTVTISVQGYLNGTGTYGIVYSTSSTRPTP
jgi:hypothetical protein